MSTTTTTTSPATPNDSTDAHHQSSDDEKLRKLLKPNPAHDQIIAALKASFFNEDDHVEIRQELDSYDDRNYLIEVRVDRNEQSKELFLLKVHNGVESRDLLSHIQRHGDNYYASSGSVIHLQNALMEHLNVGDKNNNKIPTSAPQRVIHRTSSTTATATGAKTQPPPVHIQNLPVVCTDQGNCDLAMRLLSWLPGRPMSNIPMLPIETLADAGRFLGRMDHRLDEMESSAYSAGRRNHQWDTKHTVGLRRFTPYISNPLRRQLVEGIIDTFQAQILDSGVASKFRLGINHGDYNDANILVDQDLRVCGVIDFGDSVESWRVLEISVALAYAFLTVYGKSGRSLSAAAAMLRGCHSVYPLTELERQHLHLLIACRLACSVTLGAYSYQQNPENKYLLFHAEPAWTALEMLWGNGDAAKRNEVAQIIHSLFDQACDYETKTSSDSSTVIECTDLQYPDSYWLSGAGIIHGNSRPAKVQKLETPAGGDIGKPLITFVTGNKKKLEEVVRIMGSDLPCTIDNRSIDLPELQGDDPDEISRQKCLLAVQQVGSAVITEDTSLCFNALHGLPGPYIKWFLEKCGHDGLNQMIAGWDDKSGYAQTIVGYCAGPGQAVVTFEGRTHGTIVPPRGNLDFGWDPVFEPTEGNGKTYAEMSKKEKDSISHRSRAFVKLRTYLIEKYNPVE